MTLPGRLWRGWSASYHQSKTIPRIAEWSWPLGKEVAGAPAVHVLVGDKSWQRAAWMLASWLQFSEHTWPIFIHDDGTLPKEGCETLQKLLPNARIISRREADAAVEPPLRSYPFCADFRKLHPFALKLFDVAHFTPSNRFFLFGSDLLFFNHPREILDWVAGGTDECWFNEDVKEESLITAAEARSELEIKIWPRVNSGLCLLAKSVIDLDLCDRALAQTSILTGDVHRIEQTLHMLCAARHGKGGRLPRTYEVSLRKNAAEDAISRRYIGPVRDLFYTEGVKRLSPIFFPLEHAS